MAAPPPKQSKELATAFRDDLLYQQRDAAKFRAVGQRVDYDTFKNMVSVAHLKPLQAPNTTSGRAAAPAFDFAPDGTRPVNADDGPSVADLAASLPSTRPANEREFEQAWKRVYKTKEQRVEYLKNIPAAELGSIFKVEISLILLGDIIVVLASMLPTEGASAQQAAEVAAYLSSLTSAGRFGFNSKLIAGKSKQTLQDLVNRIEACAEATVEHASIGPEEIRKLRSLYGLPEKGSG